MTDCMENKTKQSGEPPASELPMDMAVCLDKFARTFEASARRWELVVYPSLLAFIVLASYGFYLIYNLTTDVARLAQSMETVVVSMDDVATHMDLVSGNVAVISGNLTSIATEVSAKSATMVNMLNSMERMNTSMNVMTVPMIQMRQDMAHLNHNMHNFAGPMKVIGNMFPF